jgi:hypothetical protein
MTVFGPGTLNFGEVGTEIDASCLVNSLRITMTKDEADSTTKLCGTVKPGKITYTYAMSGNLDIDGTDPAGLFALSQAEPGSEVPFTFVPNTEDETSAAGVLVIDPMDFGADEYGDDLNSDIEWTLVGKPVYTYPAAPPLADAAAGGLVVNGRNAKPERPAASRRGAKAAASA